MSLDYFGNTYNPTALNPDTYGAEYAIFRDDDPNTPGFQFNVFNREATVFTRGGRSDNQNIQQESSPSGTT